MVSEQGSFWKPIVENMERGLEDRFSWEWFRAHPITRNLLTVEIRWGNTLEVACGLGIRSLILHEAKQCPVTGLDNDDFAIEYARQAASRRQGLDPEAVRFASGSFYSIPFPDASFDNVVLTAGIEHALYPVQVVDEIRRVTKNGGTLFLSVTENNFHADPDHLSSWNVATLTRLLSNYGAVRSWVDENIIFALLSFTSIGEATAPRVVLCDLLTQDTYTPQWVAAFQRLSDLTVIGLDQTGITASPELVDSLKSACRHADILHLGTGANFTNTGDVLLEIADHAPSLLVSKWWGDTYPASRYENEVLAPSHLFHQVFVATSTYIGQVSPNCGQIHLAGTFEPREIVSWIPWRERPLDIFVAANAYSHERLKRRRDYHPPQEFSWLWVGDGSPNGRVPRQSATGLFGLARIALNVEDERFCRFAHHIPARLCIAMGNGDLVMSSRKEGLASIIAGLVVQLEDNPLAWHMAYREWLCDADDDALADILWANLLQVYNFHTYDYKVYCILRHAGFAVARPASVPPPVLFDKHKLLGGKDSRPCRPGSPSLEFLAKEGLKYDPAKGPDPFAPHGASMPGRLCLDLGCGAVKPEGFIGADRYALRGVDVILDLEASFPFATGSVDFLMASHSLEHTKDLMSVVREIYRVCKDGAQVCIVAPYDKQSLNQANPYHYQVFNEHTPRFWTNASWTPIDPEEYSHPHAQEWGLSESDYSAPGVDLRCLKLEFFYFPAYRQLSEADQRLARKKYLDVCDQIMYHLIVVKEPTSEVEMKKLAEDMEYYDPPYVTIRRLSEEKESLRNDIELVEKEKESLRNDIELVEKEKELFKTSLKLMSSEVEEMRRRKAIRLVSRLKSPRDLSADVVPVFRQLLDDSYIFNDDIRGYRLQPSISLHAQPFLYYPLRVNRAKLSGILLAFIIDVPLSQGEAGIEIVSASGSILHNCRLPVTLVYPTCPTKFTFPPLEESAREDLWLRVFVSGVDVPVRLFEWQRYKLWGLGRLERRAFCGYIFDG